MFDTFDTIKSQFPVFQHHPDIVFLDTAASSQKPACVIQSIMQFYESSYANIHRGDYKLAELAEEKFEQARKNVANFIGANSEKEIVITKNATESINLVARSLCDKNFFQQGDRILVSEGEHHANLVPWMQVAEKTGAELVFISINEDKNLNIQELEKELEKGAKILAITHLSNVLGTINPIKNICNIAKAHNILTLIDGSQAVAHIPVNVQDLDCDFYVFSSHKMYGPTGVGILYGKYDILNTLPAFLGGGDMINSVDFEGFTTKKAPGKFEAGTPPIAEMVGLGEACKFLQNLDMPAVQKHDQEISAYAHQELSKIPEIKIFSHKQACGLISFEVEGIRAYDISDELNEKNICVRVGKHCAHTLIDSLSCGLLLRASFGVYTDTQDIDIFVKALREAIQELH